MNRISRYRAIDLLDVLINGTVISILMLILIPVSLRGCQNADRVSCQYNLQQIMAAIGQYGQDYDGKFPLVNGARSATNLPPYTRPYGWADALYPYSKSTEIFHCPARGFEGVNPKDSTQKGFTDYWFNQRLSGAELDSLSANGQTIILGDGKDNQSSGDARYAISGLSQDWRQRSDSPAHLHPDGANYVLFDGHIAHMRSLNPDKIQNNTPPSRGMPTFRTGEDKPKPFTNRRKISQ